MNEFAERDTAYEQFVSAIEPHREVMARLAARLAPRQEHEDVTQDALSLAWRHRGSFDPDRGTWRAWLLAITANCAQSAHRRGRRFPDLMSTLPERPAKARRDHEADVETALDVLSKRQRMAIECFYFVGLSVLETATLMDCSEGTVKSTLADARRRLRKELEPR